MRLRQLFEEAPAKRIVAVMPGGFHPFHPGHKSLYDYAVKTFGKENVYVAATNDTKTRPFPFEIKRKLAAMAGVPEQRFIQVKSPFNALSYESIIGNPADTALVFVRSEKDIQSHPLPDQIRKSDGMMGYLISYDNKDNLETADTHGYMAYGPTIDFTFSGMQIKSASELRSAWPQMSDDEKIKATEIMYPGQGEIATQLLNQALDIKTESIIFTEAATKADADAMVSAIKAFQTAAGLKADGIVGPNTRAKAGEMIKDPAQAPAVTTLQNAIKDFQTKAGIAVDGKVGPETMGAIKTAQSGGTGATATADNANTVDGAAATPAEQPQSASQATASAGQPQTPDPNAQKAEPEDPNATTPVPTDKQAPEQPAEPAQQPAEPEQQPAAEPKVSREVYMQMAPDRDADITNFNVQKMKAKYPEPYLDIPNDDGTVTRAYGPEKNLQNFIQTNNKGKGLKLSGGASASAEPEQDAGNYEENKAKYKELVKNKDYKGALELANSDPKLKDRIQKLKLKNGKTMYDTLVSQAGGEQTTEPEAPATEPQTKEPEAPATEPQTTEPEAQDEKPTTARTKMYDVNGTQMSGNDISKRMNQLLRKASANEGIVFKSSIAKYLGEALTNAERQELQSLVNAVKGEKYFQVFLNRLNDKLKAAGVEYDGGQGTSSTAGPDDGSRRQPASDAPDDDFKSGSEYTLNGKKVSRDEYEKEFGKDVSGRANDYKKLKNQIEGLTKQAQDEKRKWTQDQLNNPDSPYYKEGVPTEPEDPDYPKELIAIDDKYKAKGERLQAKADELLKDPEVKKFVDSGGKDDFDKLLSGDDDKFDTLFKTDGSSKRSVSGKSTSSSTSSTSSSTTVRTSGGSSTTKKTSGGGSTTRFSKQMKDGPDTEKLRQEKKEVRKKMRDFAKQWKKDNPDGDRFGAMDTPEYQALEKEYDSYRGMDGKIAQSKELLHPAGEMDSEGNIKYYGKGANKDGTWDGEQFDPDRKKKESIELDRIKMLAGV